jgi:hypothetical protein
MYTGENEAENQTQALPILRCALCNKPFDKREPPPHLAPLWFCSSPSLLTVFQNQHLSAMVITVAPGEPDMRTGIAHVYPAQRPRRGAMVGGRCVRGVLGGQRTVAIRRERE